MRPDGFLGCTVRFPRISRYLASFSPEPGTIGVILDPAQCWGKGGTFRPHLLLFLATCDFDLDVFKYELRTHTVPTFLTHMSALCMRLSSLRAI